VERELDALRRELFDWCRGFAAYEAFRTAGKMSQRTPEEVATRAAAIRRGAAPPRFRLHGGIPSGF
jgi:hypothetical protein